MISKNNQINKEFIEPFFVGLFEGDGTITCYLNKSKLNIYIVVKFTIALSDTPSNKKMLESIQSIIGGNIGTHNKKDKDGKAIAYVTWDAKSKQAISNVLDVLTKYPFITARKQCQLEFAKTCLENPFITTLKDRDEETFLNDSKIKKFYSDRDNQYGDKEKRSQILLKSKAPSYFSPWFSGFVEAEGNFSLVFNDKNQLRKSGFSIGQLGEFHIFNWVKAESFANSTNKVGSKMENGKEIYHRFHLYNKASRTFLFQHFSQYPLLGEKRISYDKFYLHHNPSSLSNSIFKP